MVSVGQLLRSKGNHVWSVSPETTVYDAIKVMADKEVGALLVMDGDKLAGIVSERDYARKVILRGRSSKNTPVRDIMTERVLYVRPEQTIEECMALMTAKRVRHLPVCDGARVIGVVSIGDLVKSVISQQEYLIQQLENYIAGR
jgi:CBS domain-containing protein